MANKTLDCVEMKRKGSQKVYEAIKGMTREEELAYWRVRDAEMRKWLEKTRAKSGKTVIT
jgi:hypothetical protein